jgi:hypothetical protein
MHVQRGLLDAEDAGDAALLGRIGAIWQGTGRRGRATSRNTEAVKVKRAPDLAFSEPIIAVFGFSAAKQ